MSSPLEDVAKEARKQALESVTTAYDKAAAYTNIILAAGYAGAFATWGFTKDKLNDQASALVALLLTISLTGFILFEVFKMIALTASNRRVSDLLSKELLPQLFLQELSELKTKDRMFTVRWVFPLWALALAITVPTGIAAGSILAWNYLAILFDWSLWP